MKIIQKIKTLYSQKKSTDPPVHYFISVLRWAHRIMIIYFAGYMVLAWYFQMDKEFHRAILWMLLSFAAVFLTHHITASFNLGIYSIRALGWSSTFVYNFGWDCGGQNFIIPLMIIVFFSIYHSVPQKVFFLILLFSIRMYLFYYSLNYPPQYALESRISTPLQLLSTTFIFLQITVVCLLFSSNIQKAEKQLTIYNEELRRQASTDALTGLYNRRYMVDILEKEIQARPSGVFSVALGDIDLFKNINDTLGHNFGDQVLVEISRFIQDTLQNRGIACRWGGEEFLLFLPDMNIDDASRFIADINSAIGKLDIIYKDQRSHVTMTFGVEEFSPGYTLTDLIKYADDKLYYGKRHGRNQVVS